MRAAGDFGLIAAGVGIIIFTMLFMTSVRWWTDHLGRAIAAFFGSVAAIFALVIVRVAGFPLPGVQVWRAFLFNAMAVSMWAGLVGFVWAQFVQRRVRLGRTPLRRRDHTVKPPKAPFVWALAGLIVMAFLTTVQTAIADRHINAQEWTQVAIQAVMAANVYLSANLPKYESVKRYVAAVIAGLQLFYTLVPGGVDMPELINLAITIVAALGVVFSPQPLTRTVDGQVRVYRADDGPPRATTTR